MMDTRSFQVSSNFSMDEMFGILSQKFQNKGYYVQSDPRSGQITVSKNSSGLNQLIGMEEKVSLQFNVNNNNLICNINALTWSDKTVAILLGLFLCFIPLLTAFTGMQNQKRLLDELIYDVNSYASKS